MPSDHAYLNVTLPTGFSYNDTSTLDYTGAALWNDELTNSTHKDVYPADGKGKGSVDSSVSTVVSGVKNEVPRSPD